MGHRLNAMAIPRPLSRPEIEPYLVEQPTMSSLNQKGAESSGDRIDIDRRKGRRNPQQLQTDSERDRGRFGTSHGHMDPNRPVEQASYWAMQAQIRLLMERMEMIEIEGLSEAPPEYASAYGSNR
ncbi:hypothetical protein AAF712_014884 [Marasmius tenuissimus]|uniref:Uncharacterized protein n=1 Tax=Marasmius tenuissimus TaxID=585030 RepID=A0ABR2Z9U3_9AGAR